MEQAEKQRIVEQLGGLVAELAPDASLRPMYGGLVIEMRRGDAKSRVGGIYTYTAHVSLELARGASFDDPDGLLEGGGRFRRHIKLRAVHEITSKNCERFLREAFNTD